jgi:putative membrane protein
MEERNDNTRDHLANERTFLAWIRTSIGIMAFGFVVVKFSLFLKQISLILGKENIIHTKGYSGILGIVLVAVGTVTSVLSYIRFTRSKKQLDEGRYKHSSLLITILTAFIFLVSIFLIVYLVDSIN